MGPDEDEQPADKPTRLVYFYEDSGDEAWRSSTSDGDAGGF